VGDGSAGRRGVGVAAGARRGQDHAQSAGRSLPVAPRVRVAGFKRKNLPVGLVPTSADDFMQLDYTCVGERKVNRWSLAQLWRVLQEA